MIEAGHIVLNLMVVGLVFLCFIGVVATMAFIVWCFAVVMWIKGLRKDKTWRTPNGNTKI